MSVSASGRETEVLTEIGEPAEGKRKASTRASRLDEISADERTKNLSSFSPFDSPDERSERCKNWDKDRECKVTSGNYVQAFLITFSGL